MRQLRLHPIDEVAVRLGKVHDAALSEGFDVFFAGRWSDGLDCLLQGVPGQPGSSRRPVGDGAEWGCQRR